MSSSIALPFGSNEVLKVANYTASNQQFLNIELNAAQDVHYYDLWFYKDATNGYYEIYKFYGKDLATYFAAKSGTVTQTFSE